MTVYYKNEGGEYIPIRESHSDFIDAYPEGAHLIICKPGIKYGKYDINPNHAALIAAAYMIQNDLTQVVIEASKIKHPGNKKLTPNQRQAWENLMTAFGEEAQMLSWPSAQEVIDTLIKSLVKEADRLMNNPAVEAAYNDFLTISKLTEE